MPAQVQSGRFADALTALFNTQGGFGLQVIDDVFTFVDLGRPPPDLAWAMDTTRFEFACRWAAQGAGIFGCVTFINPSSTRLVVIERLLGTTSGVQVFGSLSWQTPLAGGAGFVFEGHYVDMRNLDKVAPSVDNVTLRAVFETRAVAPSLEGLALSPGSGIEYPIILAPGQAFGFQMVATTANVAGGIAVLGFDRPCGEQERG